MPPVSGGMPWPSPSTSRSYSPSASKGGSTRTRPRFSFGGRCAPSASQPSSRVMRLWKSPSKSRVQRLVILRISFHGRQRSCGPKQHMRRARDPGLMHEAALWIEVANGGKIRFGEWRQPGREARPRSAFRCPSRHSPSSCASSLERIVHADPRMGVQHGKPCLSASDR